MFMFSSQYDCHIYTYDLVAEPRHRGAALSEPMVRGVGDAHLSSGSDGPEQHQLPAARGECFL